MRRVFDIARQPKRGFMLVFDARGDVGRDSDLGHPACGGIVFDSAAEAWEVAEDQYGSRRGLRIHDFHVRPYIPPARKRVHRHG